MNLALVQISDIHIECNNPPSNQRADSLIQAVASLTPAIDGCILCFTGDIVFSGSIEEFEIARNFIERITGGLKERLGVDAVHSFYIPGNHDCVLPKDDRARLAVVQDVLAKPPVPEDPAQSSLQYLLTAQLNFDRFVSDIGEVRPSDVGARLRWQHRYSMSSINIEVVCYNTACLSLRHEQRGQLLAPTWLPELPDITADIVITAFHHPYTWLETHNYHQFRKNVEHSSDIVMTGHEHVADHYTKSGHDGRKGEYIEAPAFNDEDGSCGFNVILLDFDTKREKLLSFSWVGSQFNLMTDNGWRSYERNIKLRSRPFEPLPDFTLYLNDLGTGFQHPKKQSIVLRDLYVYPDLGDRTYDKLKTEHDFSSSHLVGYLQEHKHVVLMGAQQAGKTTLAKILYEDLLSRDLIPVLISGNEMDTYNNELISRLEGRAVERQYGKDVVQRYSQLPRNQKVLIIDDFDLAHLNRAGLNAILLDVRQRYDYIVLFTNELFQTGDLLSADNKSETATFRFCTLKEFGYRLRLKLISNWHKLGNEYVTSEVELDRNVAAAENLVNTILGKNVLPRYPLFVFTILQFEEANQNHASYGAFGYHYEALITASLTVSTKKISLDTLYTFSSFIAFDIYLNEVPMLSAADLRNVGNTFKQRKSISESVNQLSETLVRARILTLTTGGAYRFTYPYIYYYFVARYFSDNLSNPGSVDDLRQRIRDMAKNLHVEEFTNILIFLIYLTKDPETIQLVLEQARTIYADREPCDFDKDLQFIKGGDGRSLRPILSDSSIADNQENHRRHLDEVDKVEAEVQEVNDVLRINTALKAIQILGQIVRNFPGTLDGPVKLEITKECYMLGLRACATLLKTIEADIDGFSQYITAFLRENREYRDDAEGQRKLDNDTNMCVWVLMCAVGYYFIQRVTDAVGSQHLERTYEELDGDQYQIATHLISTNIRLNHFGTFPEAEVIKLSKMLDAKPYASTVLQFMVRDHFYLFNEPGPLRQSICERVGIQLLPGRALGQSEKRNRGTARAKIRPKAAKRPKPKK